MIATPITAINAAEIHGAALSRPSNRDVREDTTFNPTAATIPMATSVMARPIENALTNVIPKANWPKCKHNMNIVMAAGQGIRPPESPKRIVCHVPTFPLASRSLISAAWNRACASKCASS